MNFQTTCIIVVSALFLAGCERGKSTSEIRAVKPFSLQHYLGTWYEAARMPHSFEKGMEYVGAEYSLLPDGRIQVLNKGFKNGKECVIRGYARQKIKNSGELEVSFFRPFYGAYRIIALKEDYSAALLTSSTKDYAWILVRDPKNAEKIIAEYVTFLQEHGFDCSKLQYPKMRKEP